MTDTLSSSLATDASGNAIPVNSEGVRYYAYGAVRSGVPANLQTDRTFTGQKADETGLMFFEARYYDSALGTFLSPDTLVPEPGRVFDYNRYMYVRGNALKYNDPSGHCSSLSGGTGYSGNYSGDDYEDGCSDVGTKGVTQTIQKALPDTYTQGVSYEVSVIAAVGGEKADVWDARNNRRGPTSSFGGGVGDPKVAVSYFEQFGFYSHGDPMKFAEVNDALSGVSFEIEGGASPVPVLPISLSAAYGDNGHYVENDQERYRYVRGSVGVSAGLPVGGHIFGGKTGTLDQGEWTQYSNNVEMAQAFVAHQKQRGAMETGYGKGYTFAIAAWMIIK